MAQAVEPERGAGSVSFEVERFEPRGGGQLMLSGRWFGLRGRRFVRPTLTLGSGDNAQRALADLEHKPWAADDGELWKAAFPIERLAKDPGKIELTVAPDVTVALPPPGAGAREQRIKARPRRDDLLDNLRGARRDGRPATGSGNGRGPRRDGRSATGWEEGLEAQREAPRVPDAPAHAPAAPASGDADSLALRLSQAQREIERLRTELARQDGVEVEAASALSRRDAAVSRLTEALAARDQATQAYEQAVRARDQALRDRDNMRKQLDRTAKERDQALRDRERAIAKANKAADATAARVDHRPAVAHAAVAATRAATSPWVVWTQRVLAVSVLVVAVLAFAITARLL